MLVFRCKTTRRGTVPSLLMYSIIRWYGTPSSRLTSKDQHNTIHQQRWYGTPSGRLASKDQHNTIHQQRWYGTPSGRLTSRRGTVPSLLM
jgi:hypothetical protein